MKKIFKQIANRETLSYLIFGIMTTIVNFGTFIVFNQIFGKRYYLLSNIFTFIIATLFAFVTNKQFVFQSKTWAWNTLITELLSFTAARVGTFLIIEEAGLWIAVEFLNAGSCRFLFLNGILLAKISLAFLAVLVNYILSKCFIFKK
ncbi:GtrA family protein [Lachnospiraceae bacterium 56-18]